jgi:hypothetical protein
VAVYHDEGVDLTIEVARYGKGKLSRSLAP